MLELGKRIQSDISVSSLPKKKILTFSQDDSLGKVINLMFENNARKLLLENSNQFISDRIILGHISQLNKFEKEVENYFDIPIKDLPLDYVHELKEDVKFDRLCYIMDKMDHPFVIYNDNPISPWDICLTLSENVSAQISTEYQKVVTCPHCGKDID